MIGPIVETLAPVAEFAGHHLPGELLPRGDIMLAALVVGGVFTCTLGAKLARAVLTLALIGTGVATALEYGDRIELPLPATVVLSGALVGLIGYLLFRLWVGIAAGLVLALLAVSIYGSAQIVPHMKTFDPTAAAITSASMPTEETLPTFTVPEVPADECSTKEVVVQTFDDFRAHLRTQDADVETYVRMIALAAGLFGLVLGVLAVRFTLVFGTAFLGTAMLATAAGLGLRAYGPDAWATLSEHPVAVNAIVACLFLASVVLQTLLTRRSPHTKTDATD